MAPNDPTRFCPTCFQIIPNCSNGPNWPYCVSNCSNLSQVILDGSQMVQKSSNGPNDIELFQLVLCAPKSSQGVQNGITLTRFWRGILTLLSPMWSSWSSTVTVLWREEGYTMNHCLSPRDFQRAQAIFHRIPRLKSQYSHSQLPILPNIFSYWLREFAIFSRIG